jgi:hypothetical protein
LKRYELIPPVPHGERYWLISDTQWSDDPNFAIVQIAAWAPDAEVLATKICAALNAAQSI